MSLIYNMCSCLSHVEYLVAMVNMFKLHQNRHLLGQNGHFMIFLYDISISKATNVSKYTQMHTDYLHSCLNHIKYMVAMVTENKWLWKGMFCTKIDISVYFCITKAWQLIQYIIKDTRSLLLINSFVALTILCTWLLW